jgi:alkylation response protein AidB-like acyl-CoA dehydrogenase
MNFDLTEEQRAIRNLARDFAAQVMAPHAAKWDEDCTFPLETLRQAAALGFAGITVREDVGGSGLTRLDGALVFEELAGACASTAAFLSIDLPGLVTLERTASYCLTEPGAGSDAASLQTQARRDGDTYRLTGTKAFISGAGTSDLYLVLCRTGGHGPDSFPAPGPATSTWSCAAPAGTARTASRPWWSPRTRMASASASRRGNWAGTVSRRPW